MPVHKTVLYALANDCKMHTFILLTMNCIYKGFDTASARDWNLIQRYCFSKVLCQSNLNMTVDKERARRFDINESMIIYFSAKKKMATSSTPSSKPPTCTTTLSLSHTRYCQWNKISNPLYLISFSSSEAFVTLIYFPPIVTVWIIGDSCVRRGAQRAAETIGSNLGLNLRVCWFKFLLNNVVLNVRVHYKRQ